MLTSWETESARSAKRPKSQGLWRRRIGRVVLRAENFGDLITADRGKPKISVLKETIPVPVTISISVQNRHSRILLRALPRGRMREVRRKPEILETRVSVVECLDDPTRITSKELPPFHSVKSGILQKSCSTNPRVDVDLVKSALVGIDSSMNSLANGTKRMVTRVQWLRWKKWAASKNSEICFGWWLIKYTTIGLRIPGKRATEIFTDLRKSSGIGKPFRCVKFTEAVVRHTDIRDQNPSFEEIFPSELPQRNPNAPKIEERSQDETEWQERCARGSWSKISENERI